MIYLRIVTWWRHFNLFISYFILVIFRLLRIELTVVFEDKDPLADEDSAEYKKLAIPMS